MPKQSHVADNAAGLTWLLVLSLCGSLSAEQRLTIPELVELHRPEPVHLSRVREVMPPDLDELARRATLVVRGHVQRIRTYLSEDQRTIYTDYQVESVRLISSRSPLLGADPGRMPIVFTVWGGETMVNGVRVVMDDLNMIPLEDGADTIVFLRPRATGDALELVSEIAAIFSVDSNNRIHPHVAGSPTQDDLARLTADEFVREIQRAAQSGKAPR
jgi:hypothetical protein